MRPPADDLPRPRPRGVSHRWALAASLVAGAVLVLGLDGLLPRVVASAALPAGALFAGGGVLYTAGAVVYVRRRPDPLPALFGFHGIFRLFVIATAVAHFVAIAVLVIPEG